MSIEKKSLISNRTATKKALVAKPEVSKVASTRVIKPRLANVHAVRLSTFRMKK
jgi:hypothetical protein